MVRTMDPTASSTERSVMVWPLRMASWTSWSDWRWRFQRGIAASSASVGATCARSACGSTSAGTSPTSPACRGAGTYGLCGPYGANITNSGWSSGVLRTNRFVRRARTSVE